MRIESFVLILTALVIQQAAAAHEEKKLNGRHIKVYKPQQRSNVGEARFTSDILNKLALKDKLSTTTAAPTITYITYIEPTTTSSDWRPSGTTTSATSGSEIDPDTTSATSAIDGPGGSGIITSDTSALDPAYSATSSSPTAGSNVITSLPQLPERPQPPQQPPAVDIPSNPSFGPATSRAVADNELLNDNEDGEEEEGGNSNDVYNDDENENFVVSKNRYHLNRNRDDDLNDNLQFARASRPRPANLRRNQLRRRRNQQVNKNRVRTVRNRTNQQIRRRNPNRKQLTRRQQENLRNRHQSSHRRRLLKRRINTRRNGQRRPTVRYRRPTNRNQINNNRIRHYRRRPVQRIVIRGA